MVHASLRTVGGAGRRARFVALAASVESVRRGQALRAGMASVWPVRSDRPAPSSSGHPPTPDAVVVASASAPAPADQRDPVASRSVGSAPGTTAQHCTLADRRNRRDFGRLWYPNGSAIPTGGVSPSSSAKLNRLAAKP